MKKQSLLYLIVLINFFHLKSFSQGTDYIVGKIEGRLSVSLTGAATYNVPISVPPGINGVKPNISIVYNSQSGDGTVGYGWNIGGLSAITRIPSTKYHDGIIDPVDLDQYDRFALDGQRLILKSGTYGGDGAVYVTENYSNIKVISYGNTGHGPATFKVFYPDGSVAEYGNNSYHARTITSWMINLKENAQGIYIAYTYYNSFQNPTIMRIRYGEKRGHAPKYEIIFNYRVDRSRYQYSYIGSSTIRQMGLLSKIIIKKMANGEKLRNYLIRYDIDKLGYKRLVQIQEKNGNETGASKHISFSYDNSQAHHLSHSEFNSGLTNTTALNTNYISGDFNGDTRLDFIAYPIVGSEKYKKVWINIYNGSNNTLDHQTIDFNSRFQKIFTTNWLNQNNKLLGYNGFGVVFQKILGNNSSVVNEVNIKLYKPGSPSVGSSLVLDYEKTINDFPTTQVDHYYGGQHHYRNVIFNKKYFEGDFNGDGLTDIIAIDTYAMSSYSGPYGGTGIPILSNKVYFIDINRNSTNNFWTEIGELPENLVYQTPNMPHEIKPIVKVGDFNGDGKSDLAIFSQHKIEVYSIDDNNHLVNIISKQDISIDIAEHESETINNNNYPSYKKPILLGDFNGDGKMDFIIPREKLSYIWHEFISAGDSFEKFTVNTGVYFSIPHSGLTNIAVTNTYYHALFEFAYLPTDINGDGKTDLIKYFNVLAGLSDTNGQQHYPPGTPLKTNIITYNNMGSSSSSPAIRFSLETDNTFDITNLGIEKNALPIILNHNQINQNLEVSILSKDKIHYFLNDYNHMDEVLLKRIYNHGIKETIHYSGLSSDMYLDNGLQAYKYDTNLIYPNYIVRKSPNFKVVTKLEREQTFSNYHVKKYYSYYNFGVNLEGLGIKGFEAIMTTNWHDDSSPIISSVDVKDFNLRGAVKFSYTKKDLIFGNYMQLPSNFITKTINHYTANISQNNIFKLKLNSTVKYNGLNDTSEETSYEYDNLNLVTNKVEKVFESGNIEQLTTSRFYYQNNANGGNSSQNPYYIGKLTRQTIKNEVGSNIFQTEEQFSFYPNLLLKTHKLKSNNSYFITTNLYYDSQGYGNLIRKTVTPDGANSRTTEYEYDSSHRFIKKKIDIEGLETQYTYDVFGNILTETDPYGRTTTNVYDTWGNLVQSFDFLGNETRIVYQNTWGYGTRVWTYHPDGSIDFNQTDALGRETYSAHKGFDNQFKYYKTEYDIYDRVITKIGPYINNPNPDTDFVSYTYDEYGRIIETDHSNGHYIHIDYNGLNQVVNDNGKVKTIRKNAIGQIVSVTDDGGTIYYTYNANGKVISTTLAGTNISIDYDEWGRKIKITDPSAGTYEYKYNKWGEIIHQTSPNGSFDYRYDPYGKIIEKTITGESYLYARYFYDSNTKKLTKVIGIGPKFIYEYDNYQRLKRTREITNDHNFINEYTYDGLGRISTNRKISSYNGSTADVTLKYHYYNGIMNQIRDNATNNLLWQISGTDVRDHIIQQRFGNGLTQLKTFDNNTGVLLGTNLIDGNGNSLYQINYNFDAGRGILNSRNNSFVGFNESFNYDDLDRLIEYTDIHGHQQRQSYDPLGRIHKNFLGIYNYQNTNKKYQNTSIEELTSFGNEWYSHKDPIQQIKYNAFNKPVIIGKKEKVLDFKYNIFGNRYAMNNFETRINKYYSSDKTAEIKINENTGNIEHTLYLNGDPNSASIIYRKDSNGGKFMYLHRDYLGSIVAISKENGEIAEKRAFDAWGNLIKIEDGLGHTLHKFNILDRGYTAHEHLFSVGLINMNARLYDPLLHRFLSVDPYVQNPTNTQNFNRYGYVLNNPLSYKDPTGEIAWFVIPMIAGVINWGIHGFKFSWYGFFDFAIGFGTALIPGLLGFGPEIGFIRGFASGAISSAISGYTSAFAYNLEEGKSLEEAFFNSFSSIPGAALTGGLIQGLFGGIRAVSKKLRFIDAAKVEKIRIETISGEGVEQIKNNDCLPSTMEYEDKIHGIHNTSQDYYRNLAGGNGDTDPIYIDKFAEKLSETGRHAETIAPSRLNVLVKAIKNNDGIIVGTQNHALAVKAIVFKNITKLSGKFIHRTLFEVMDPASGFFKTISSKSLKSAIIIDYH